MSTTASRVRRTTTNTQITHSFARRINDIQTYPYRSPQGATILIHCHDSGVTITWRGGRRFKQKPKVAKKDRTNGKVDDSVMVIDSDDEAPPSKGAAKFEDKPEFEEEDVDETPHSETVQTLDLTFGTAVQNVAVMPVTPGSGLEDRVPILRHKLVFTASTVTNDVYLVTLPLTPPSPESKARPELKKDLLAGKAGSGAWGETLVLLRGNTRLSDGLAIGLYMPETDDSGKQARAVVAAHSREASGVLRLWEVPLDPKSKMERQVEPFQTEFLPAPLTGISFNPTHRSQLLTVTASQGARVYDFARSSLPTDPDATGIFPTQGSWQLTLYQPFVRPSALRKPIVAAAWICHGHAVFTIMADGMWGIWDIDSVGATSSGSLLSKASPGIRGAAITAFSVSGYVDGTSLLRSTGAHHTARDSQSGDFAPMTPHTRKQTTANIHSPATADRFATVHGGIKVASLPSTEKGLPDESLALWIGSQEHVCLISGVSKFWESQVKKAAGAGNGSALFNGPQPVKMSKLQDLSTGLLGERCCGIDLITSAATSQPEVLLRGETRIVFVHETADAGKKSLTTKRRLFSAGHKSSAIIVHGGNTNRTPSASFNLSTVKPGTLRQRPTILDKNDHSKTADSLFAPRQNLGFGFGSTLDKAADYEDGDEDMLDIAGIDQALDGMNGRTGGKKRVLFEED
ncbi:uncharacterized protein F5Z01DRAFT_664072 [Emericellopsis atlantica]|uniref:Nucleoporin NUP37 n=1 Tax=Emericellopsis atlantica TaxID=2614577 RepID=A0A9P7ZG67_9HYPO|nr:uncharacterized protein F5Z01DRAFT_664072 [Emericellopsis atlantica]KAG9251136.1 hypothetical protein F5Z01DRAFT_664072 [Emericellopsis atlantica]